MLSPVCPLVLWRTAKKDPLSFLARVVVRGRFLLPLIAPYTIPESGGSGGRRGQVKGERVGEKGSISSEMPHSTYFLTDPKERPPPKKKTCGGDHHASMGWKCLLADLLVHKTYQQTPNTIFARMKKQFNLSNLRESIYR